MEIVNEIGSIPYWVRESEINAEFVHKKMPGGKPGLCVAEVFLL